MARKKKESNGGGRVAIIDGIRTPFLRAYTDFKDLTPVDLGKFAVRELLERTELNPEVIDEVIFGCVLPPVSQPNIAREVVLALG
ncbi:MAG: acetyl-CoA C-acyltransferase, partial [Candidatus Eremiobacterota bacterium]